MYTKTFSILFSLSVFFLIFGNEIQAHSWEAPKQEAQRQNPIALNPTSINEGKNLFIENCAKCHGNQAKGLKAEETGLSKDTGNLKMRLAGHSDGDFFWKIQHGKGDMPSFVNELEEKQIWNIINFIKSLEE